MPKSPGIHTRTNFFIEARWEDESDKRNFPSGMEFKLPYKKGSKGIAVLAIKRFLGLDASSGDFFDEITKVNLVAFQDANRQVLMEIAGYIGEDDSTLSYRSELGVVNGPTWALIMAAGDPVTAAAIPGFPSHIQPPAGVTIKVAVQETFRALESNRLLAGDSQNYNPIRTLQDNLDASDKEEPPYVDGEYYYYTYHSQITRAQVNRDDPESYKRLLLENSEKALREGTKKVLQHFNKPLEWIVNTERESDMALYGEILRFHNRGIAQSTVTVGDVSSLERRDFTRDLEMVHQPDDWDYERDPPGPDQPHIIAHGAAKLERELRNQDPDGSGFSVPGALTSFGDSNHLLTVNELPVLEALNVRRQNNPDYVSKVDVLFGQPLFEGSEPLFAAIHKVHSPKLRPGSTFKFTIRIKRRFLDGIPRDISAKEMIDTNLRSIETAVGVVDEVYQVGGKVVDYLMNKSASDIADDARGAAKRYINKFYRSGELSDKAKQMIGNELELATGVVGLFGPSEEQKKAFESSIAASSVGMESLPCARDYKNQVAFNSSVVKVQKFLKQLSTRLRSKPNPPNFKPNINLVSEANKLQTAGLALTALITTTTDAGLTGKFRLGFDVVRRRQTITVRKADGSVLTEKKRRTTTDASGNVVVKEEIVPVKKTIVVTKGMYLYAIGTPSEGITLSGPALIPLNYTIGPRTMAYLYNIMNMAKDVENPFCDKNQRVAGVQYITRYTFPTPTVLASGPILGGDTFSIDAFFAGPIKDAKDKLKEDISVLSKDPKAALWKQGIVAVERGKTYDILPRVPKEMLCTIDQLYLELLKKLDLKTLFCNFIECVPELPFPTGFEDISFDIPEIPDLPSFDPLKFIIPYLRALLIDIIVAILCALARYFISLLQIPNCQDVIQFAARKYNYYFGDNDKADTVAKATKALSAMDIPTDGLADISNSLDDVAGALSPHEFISLLKGDPSDEVLEVTDRVLRARANSFSENVSGPSDIRDFFELMGSFVDDEVANRISNYPSIILGDVPCAEDFIPTIDDMAAQSFRDELQTPGGALYTPPRKNLRDRLLDSRATDEEIDKALLDAAKNRDALKKIMSAGSEEGGLIDIPSAGCPENGGLPGPYDNQNFRNQADLAVTAVFTDIKTFFDNDIRSYVPTFFGPNARPLNPNDPEYDHVAMAEYDFVMRQLEHIFRLSESDDDEIQELASGLWMRIMKPGSIIQYEGSVKTYVAEPGDARRLKLVPRDKDEDQKRKGNQTAFEAYDGDHLFHLGDDDSGPDKNKLESLGVPTLADFVASPGDPMVLPNPALKPANNPERQSIALQASAKEKGAESPSVIKYEVYDMTKKSDQDEFAKVLMRPMDSMKNEVSILPRIRRILLDQRNFRAETSNSPYYHLDIEFMLSSLSQAVGGTRDKYGIVSSRDTGISLMATIFGVNSGALGRYISESRYRNSGDVISHYWNLLMSLWHQSKATSQVSPTFPASGDIMRKALQEGPSSVRGQDLMHQVLTDIMKLPEVDSDDSIRALNNINQNTLNVVHESGLELLTPYEYSRQQFLVGSQLPDHDNDENTPPQRYSLSREEFVQKELSEFARSCFLKFVSVIEGLQNAIANGIVTPGVQNSGFDSWWDSIQGSDYNYKKDSKIYIRNDVRSRGYAHAEEYKKIRMPESWRLLFLEVSGIIEKQMVMNVKKHFKISIGGMIEKAQHHVSKSQIHMAELPYTGPREDIKDCYLVSRWGSSPYYNIAGRDNPLYMIRHEVFTEEVKDEYKEKRGNARDVKNEALRQTLIRPGAYADILFNNARKLYNANDIIDHNFKTWEDHGPVVNNHYNPESIEKSAAWSFLTERTTIFNQDSVYAKTVDRLMDKIAYEISNSKYFETGEMTFLGNRISSVKKYVYFLKNKRLLNTEYAAEIARKGLLKAADFRDLVHHTSAYRPEDGQFTIEQQREAANSFDEFIANSDSQLLKLMVAPVLNSLSDTEAFYITGPSKLGHSAGGDDRPAAAGVHPAAGTFDSDGEFLEYDPIEVSDYQYREAIRRGLFRPSDFARCVITNKPVIDFEKVKEEALKSFFNSLCREEYAPVNRDFTKQGPLEIELQGQLVILYMKTFIYEFLFNGIFMFGNMSAGGIFDSEFVKSYIVDSVFSTISKDFDEDRNFQVTFLDKLKYLLNESDGRVALKKMVTSLTSEVINELTNVADEIFQPDFSSFKEQLFNELASDFLDGGKHFEEVQYRRRKTRGRFVQGDLYTDFDSLEETVIEDAIGENRGASRKRILPATYKNHPARQLYNLKATSITMEAGDRLAGLGALNREGAETLERSEAVSNQINQDAAIRKSTRALYARSQAMKLPIAGFGDLSEILNIKDPNGNPRYKYNTAATLARGGFYLEKYFQLDPQGLLDLQHTMVAKKSILEDGFFQVHSISERAGQMMENPPFFERGSTPQFMKGTNESFSSNSFKAFSTIRDVAGQNGTSADLLTDDAQIGFGDGIDNPVSTFFKMKYWSPSDITKLWRYVIKVDADNSLGARQKCRELLGSATIGIRMMQILPELYDKKTTKKNFTGNSETLDIRIKATPTDTSNVKDLSFIHAQQDIDNLFMQSEFLYPYQYRGRLGTISQPITALGSENNVLRDNRYGNFSTTLKSDISQFITSIEAYARSYAEDGETEEQQQVEMTLDQKLGRRNIFRRTSHKLSGINRVHKCGAMIWSPGGKAERYPLRMKDINAFEYVSDEINRYNGELSTFRSAYRNYYDQKIENPIDVVQSWYAALPDWFGDVIESPTTESLRYKFLSSKMFVTAKDFGTFNDKDALVALGYATFNGESVERFENVPTKVSYDPENPGHNQKLRKIKEFRGINKNLSEISALLNEENLTTTGATLNKYLDSLALNRKKIKFVVPIAEFHGGGIDLNPDQDDCPILGDDGNIDSTSLEKLAEKYNDRLLKGLLGLGKEKRTVNNSVVRKLENYQSANEDVKYLFDFVFPLDRYQDMFFIHNETLVKQAISMQDSGYLEPTRGAIRRQYRILENVPGQDKASKNFNFTQQEFSELLKNAEDGKGPHGGEGPDMLKDIGAALIKIAIMTPISIVRGISIMLDPAYAQMKTLMETDPCKLRKGLLWGSVGVGGVYPGRVEDGPRVNGGAGPDCNNKFHPIPWAPIPDIMLSVKDLVKGLTMFLGFPPFVYPPLIIKGANTLANTLLHIKGAITFSSERSYGSILGPAGAIALSLPEVPGEAYKQRHKDAGCAERSDPCEPSIELPEVMDICEMVQDDLEQKQEELQSENQSGGQIIEE